MLWVRALTRSFKARNFCQSFQGDSFFRAFDLANVIPGEICLFCEFFLAQVRLDALDAERFTQSLMDNSQS